MAYLCFIKCIYWAQIISWISYLRQIFYGIMSHIPQKLFSCISCISVAYPWYISGFSDIFEAYLSYISDVLKQISSISQNYKRHKAVLSKTYLKYNTISHARFAHLLYVRPSYLFLEKKFKNVMFYIYRKSILKGGVVCILLLTY